MVIILRLLVYPFRPLIRNPITRSGTSKLKLIKYIPITIKSNCEYRRPSKMNSIHNTSARNDERRRVKLYLKQLEQEAWASQSWVISLGSHLVGPAATRRNSKHGSAEMRVSNSLKKLKKPCQRLESNLCGINSYRHKTSCL